MVSSYKIRYCNLCLFPETKPDLKFDENGTCSACQAYKNRSNIDWKQREEQFQSLIKKIVTKSSSNWDCIIPVSGGKDSTAQVLKVLELNLNPLCVTATTCDLSEIGRKNIENIKGFGVDYIEFSPNKIVRKKLNKYCLQTVGDISWPEHVGIFTIPVRVAVNYQVPLIIWGENSQNEYGGPTTAQNSFTLDRRWLEEFGGLLGLRVSELSKLLTIDEKYLYPYFYPSEQELQKLGIQGIFLGHFFPWDGLANYLLAQSFGFTSLGKRIEGSMVDYENLDNFQAGIHDYFKYLKFGFGRTTDLVSMQIRRGRITREQGLKIVQNYDGEYPKSYLGKSLKDILNEIDLSENEFNSICDKFTNKKLFRTNSGVIERKSDRTPLKINYDNF